MEFYSYTETKRGLVMKIEEALKAIRKELKLTQNELAALLHITVTTVSRWESGRSTPNKLAMAVLAEHCKNNNVDENLIKIINE